MKAALDRLRGFDASISIVVDGVEVIAENPDRALIPASNQKLWTAAGAHLLLPADFTFTTDVFAAGEVTDRVLRGDLVVVGGGDPTITTKGANHSLDALAAIVRAAGIDRIAGRVVVDESRWDLTRTPAGWEPWQLEFVGPLSAFMVDWNNLRKEVGFMNDPTLENSRTFVARLAAAGVVVESGAAVGRLPAGARLVHRERSGNLQALLTFMLSESDNMMAESFVREIGLKVRGSPTHAAGLAAIDDAIRTKLCLPADGVNDDGSGVSHYSRHSARYVRTLLEVLPVMRTELAVSGRTGTLKSRLTGDLAGKVVAKTGSVRGGRALSGYATTASGKAVTFSVLLNGEETILTAKSIDDLVAAVIAGH